MSEIFAVQLTAVATLALAAFALGTAILAYLAWRKQSKEVRDQAEVLQLQTKQFKQLGADRERDALERRQQQAVQIYMWQEKNTVLTTGESAEGRWADAEDRVTAHVRNSSTQPIYDFRFSWQDANGPDVDASRWLPLMPGQEDSNTAIGADMEAVGIFRDRAGVWWLIRPDGRLEETVEPSETAFESTDNFASTGEPPTDAE